MFTDKLAGLRVPVTEQPKGGVLLTLCEGVREHFSDFRRLRGRSTGMYRRHREELERKLAQAIRLALEPTDPLTRERQAQLVEDLEFQLQSLRKAA